MAREEVLNLNHGGYEIREFENALGNVKYNEYILKKNENGVYTFLFPIAQSADTLRCQVISEQVLRVAWYKLTDILSSHLLSRDPEIDIKIDEESIQNNKEYFRVCRVDNYDTHRTTCWSSAIDVGEDIYVPFKHNDDDDTYFTNKLYITEVHSNYVKAKLGAFGSILYNFKMEDYHHTWFKSEEECIRACQCGGKL